MTDSIQYPIHILISQSNKSKAFWLIEILPSLDKATILAKTTWKKYFISLIFCLTTHLRYTPWNLRPHFFQPPLPPLNNVGSKHCQSDMKKIALATFGSPSEMRNRTWNQHCKGEGGRAEEENLIFFKSFGKDYSLTLSMYSPFTLQVKPA